MQIPKDNKPTEVQSRLGLDISKAVLVVVTFFYATGYLIQAIVLRNYGIYRLEAVKLQYVEVGVTFAVLALLVTVIPVGCFLAHFRIRRRSGLPNYRLGATGYFLNTYNLFLVVMSAALFITHREFGAVITEVGKTGWPLRFYQLFFVYIALSLVVLIFFPLVERLVVAKSKNPMAWYRGLIEPVRYGSVVIGLAFDLLVLAMFPWSRDLVLRGMTFVASACLLAGTVYAVIFYIQKLGDKRSTHLLVALGTTGVFLVLYMCINAYVYSVIRHIPMNRGGKLPVTRAFLVTTCEVLKGLPAKKDEGNTGVTVGPMYVIEETQDYLHVAIENDEDWHEKWVTTYAVKKDEVEYVRNERISRGGPRGAIRRW